MVYVSLSLSLSLSLSTMLRHAYWTVIHRPCSLSDHFEKVILLLARQRVGTTSFAIVPRF